MKHRELLFLVLALIFLGCEERNSSVTNDPVPVEPKLILYLPFNGNANDESGNGNNANTVNAILSTDRNGNSNSAYYFNAERFSGRYIQRKT